MGDFWSNSLAVITDLQFKTYIHPVLLKISQSQNLSDVDAPGPSLLERPSLGDHVSISCNQDSHCSKSSFFVQKFNFDFTIFFWVKKLVKLLWFWAFLAVDHFDFTR